MAKDNHSSDASVPGQKPLPVARPARKRPQLVEEDEAASATPVNRRTDENPRRPTRKPRIVEDEEPEEDRQRARKRRDADEDEEPDDRPRRRKKKKSRSQPEETSSTSEWIIPSVIGGVGLLMTVIGAVGAGGAGHAIVSVVIFLVAQVIQIPVTIGALMVIGGVLGIEYGTLVGAIRGLGAVSLLTNGMMAIGAWLDVPFFVYQPVVFLIGFGVFMTLFHLDVWETWITMVALDLMTWVFLFVTMIVLMGMVKKPVDDEFGPPKKGEPTIEVQEFDNDLDP